ncbi:glucosaminidase domain-containing protein [Gillisia sp. M10.2A]|uniref:Peptidoglycan hydrolase n=1 Tax=Gillisia lutea TaxID=2909668 RepID=A0ABS9EE98_9FLAO|nr:glucosaminidase domain-containing protein [Gillisia lutea]MCF4101211.1 glucosaminidase domain-containing protein [Gillisia lutea]
MNYKHLIILVITVIFTASCGSKKKIASRKKAKTERSISSRNDVPAKVNNTVKKSTPSGSYADIVEEYIADFAEIAKEEMRLYKIPASITLAQGILESGAGRGTLSRNANNHFGIKCHDWEGDKVYHDDDRSQECFRKYNNAKYSYRDHSLFLSERRRYAGLFDLDTDDYEGWAKGLRAAGYATDRKYPDKLIDLIERYSLYKFDEETLGKRKSNRSSRTIAARDGGNTYTVQKGDTLYSISKRFNTTVEMLQRYNNIQGNTISIGQELVVTPAQ